MAKRDTEDTESVVVHTDSGNPPAIRPVISGIPRIRTAKDARRAYGRLISAFTRGEIPGDEAKTLAYLLSGFLQSCTAAEIEERIEALEKKNGS